MISTPERALQLHTNLEPPLKWAGGKRWLVPKLQTMYARHHHRRLVEPCVGGCAVPLGLMPEKALLCDNNPHVINFYRWLKRGLVVEGEFVNESSWYYRARSDFNERIAAGDIWSRENAQLFYYLNRTCFNGLCRFNASGFFNVPFGRYARIPYIYDFTPYSPVCASWDFCALDFEKVAIEPEDFLYVDPPYDVEFTQYSKEGFDWSDQERLAAWIAKHPGPTVVSNQATNRILALYEKLGFSIQILPAPRRISCNGNRQPAMEMFAIRNV